MQKSSTLPFSLEASSISSWIDTLPLSQPVQAVNDIYSVLRTLSKRPEEYQQHIEPILNEVTPIAIKLSMELENLFYSESGNLDAKKRKIARLSINSLRHHTLLYFHLSHFIAKENLGLCINRCLQISNLCLKQCALIYDTPSRELWEVTGKLYNLAGSKGLFDISFNEPLSIFNKQTNIINNIKTALLFSLCQPNYLKQSEISALFSLLVKHADQLAFSNLYSTSCLYYWNYEQPNNVHVITPNSKTNSSTIYLDTSLIQPILQSNNFSFVVNKLTRQQSFIPSLTKAAPKRATVSYSFANIIGFLEQHVQVMNIHKSSKRAFTTADSLELQPFETEKKVIKTVAADDIWEREKTTELKTYNAIIKNSTNLGFSLIELKSFSEKTEELLISFDGENKPLISIIRNVDIPNINKNYQLLIENFSSNNEVALVANQQYQCKAILCKITDDLTFLLISAKFKFTTGSTVNLNNEPAILSKLLESTADFTLYQLA
ncbi:MAG: hypothetical protein GQ581_08745 [Methyloprofundus sp.]|nr:hypothetical protein [Methyloprofundus sp.]